MRNRKLLWPALAFLLLLTVYFVGPRPEKPVIQLPTLSVPESPDALETWIAEKEGRVANIRPDNQARIVWADSARRKTPYSVVYLHGFSASQGEGMPMHTDFARTYGCNLYLARLSGHGIGTPESMLEATPNNLLADALEAILIGGQIGEKVIVICTSTGATLGFYIAAERPELVHALIAYSPNFGLYDPLANLLIGPWGEQLLRAVAGGELWGKQPRNELSAQYWSTPYSIGAVLHVQHLVQATMTEKTFRKVTQPFFIGYYYKNAKEQDQVVSVDRMLHLFERTGTPEHLRRRVAFPDVGEHVIAADFVSKDFPSVQRETFRFAEQVLKLQPVPMAE